MKTPFRLAAALALSCAAFSPLSAQFFRDAQLRLPVLRDRLHLSLSANRIAPIGDRQTHDVFNYGIGIAYEHRAKPLKSKY